MSMSKARKGLNKACREGANAGRRRYSRSHVSGRSHSVLGGIASLLGIAVPQQPDDFQQFMAFYEQQGKEDHGIQSNQVSKG